LHEYERQQASVTDLIAILCPVDRSEPSRKALEHAAALAAHHGARLRVIEVASPDRAEVAWPPRESGNLDRRALFNELQEFVQPLRPAGVAVDVYLRVGDAAQEIVHESNSFPADLIVIGTHGRTGADLERLGSVTEHVLRRADCPVLTVPARCPAGTSLRAAPKTVVCGTDFSAAASRALQEALSIAQAMDSYLIVVHVIDGRRKLPSGQDTEAARRRLAEALPAEARRTIRAEDIVTTGEPALEIVRIARLRGANLIVLGVYGTGSPDVPTIGSTTYRVIRDAGSPVLTVRFGA
jgi:nucleotide-binding universal stress UspA family protein